MGLAGLGVAWENGIQATGLGCSHWEWEKMSVIQNGNGLSIAKWDFKKQRLGNGIGI